MVYLLSAAAFALLSTGAAALTTPSQQQVLDTFSKKEICPLAPKILPPEDGLHAAIEFIKDDAVKSKQLERLSRAVQVPTTVNDFSTDPYDEVFTPFLEFHKLLKSLFPLTYSYARIDHVNRLGLVFTLNGTDESLKPLLFTAHQDVVPIDDPSDWTYPPFSGYFDGEWIWGRGVSDCKNVLIGLLSVVEDLLSQKWEPKRTVVLAFGYDEESHGWLGAGSIAKELEKKWGRDSFEFILDEGGMGLETLGDVVYALPGVGEKGSIDLVLTLNVTGGHSSVPPPHTGIGIMSEIIYELERQDLFIPVLNQEHPARKSLECQVRHSPEYVEPWLADALESDDYTALARSVGESRGEKILYTFQTSQAADLFSGGVKTNALPEKISSVVNYRVALHQTPEIVKERALKIITPIAKKHNLTFTAFEDSPSDEIFNHLDLAALSEPLYPAPISPTDSQTDEVWSRFSGVSRSVFESIPAFEGKTVVVAGDIMTGNTDTRFYWNLTRNIYRWSPSRTGRSLNIHTVDERLDIAVHLEAMMLYYDLIRSF